ncbi:hypothetical protein EF294_18705 [Gordonia oryzae]|uniref:Uncharacterized protein n=1 Tax=Gordonia oryzae TaxID=2487349 RepID=A0A3N4G7C3_9ACTN|nr:hypothetical protein [Gordonia oryzae]RPA57297.1 hypothetical protein EF294_18705 [Gordonia oryzae]
MPIPPPLAHARWITTAVCAGAVVATAGIAGGLALSGDTHAATTSTGATAPTTSSSADTGDNGGPGWTPTAPAQTTENAPHAHTGAS